jgi:hypothetical protein
LRTTERLIGYRNIHPPTALRRGGAAGAVWKMAAENSEFSK